jgi:hypothetical protein
VGTLWGSGSDWPYGKWSGLVRIESEMSFDRSTTIMKNDPTTQLLWSTKEETVERHMTLDASGFSLSQRLREVTMLAADASPKPGANICTELELGAHVVQMRTFATVDVSPDVRSWTPLPTPRALPAAWETV